MHVAIATSTAVMVISASYATVKHHRKGNVRWNMVFPLAIYIGIGSIIGVYTSSMISGDWLRFLFIAYLVYTIAECVLSKSFVHRDTTKEMRKIGARLEILLGLIIGTVATLLGVGGSVLTVPLMRRLGAKMTESVAMANPLSIPVALVGAIGYVALAFSQNIELGHQYLGLIYIPAFLLLTLGALFGVGLGTKVVHKIPERTHAIVYIGLTSSR